MGKKRRWSKFTREGQKQGKRMLLSGPLPAIKEKMNDDNDFSRLRLASTAGPKLFFNFRDYGRFLILHTPGLGLMFYKVLSPELQAPFGSLDYSGKVPTLTEIKSSLMKNINRGG